MTLRVIDLANVQQFAAINLLSDPGHIAGPIVAPNCMQIRWIWLQVNGKTGFNITHARYSGGFPGTTAMADALTVALQNLFNTHGIPTFMPAGTVLAGVDLRDINSANNPIIDRSTAATLPGTSVSLPMPNEMAIALTLRTARTGQAFRGRIFIPGWSANAAAAGGVVDPTLKADLDALATGLRGVYSGQGLTMCLALPARAGYTSPRTGRVHPPRDAQTADVTAVICRDNHFDSQRRRGLK